MGIRSVRVYLMPILALVILSISLPGCLGGCDSGSSKPYAVSGRVLDESGHGIREVTLAFTGDTTGTTTTDDTGHWQADLKGRTTITPARPGYTFEPQSKVVTGASSNVNFIAASQVVLYENSKVMPATEGGNIASISEDRSVIVFSDNTDYVKSLNVGDIIAGDPVPGAPYGFLQRIVTVSADGRSITTEDASLEDLIKEAEISVSQSVSLEELMQDVVLPEDAGIRVLDPRTLVIDEEITPGVFVTGYLRFHGDIVFQADLSIWSGIKKVEFVVKTGMESDLSLHSESSAAMPRKEVVLATIAGPIITPYTGVNIHTRLSFIAGAEGQIDVGLETGFNLKRGYEVGLEWAKGTGFSPVHRITGDGWSAREPTLSGKASAFAFAGAKIDGLLYGAVGPFAELYGYGQFEAESKLSPSEMTWEYDLGVGLACVAGASLELRWLAWSISENWKTDPIQLYHVPIAYGVSGRVVDDNGAGIGNVKLQFSNGADPAYTNSSGYWSKHFLLSKKATVTPIKDGYTFVPATCEVTSGKSGVNFTGTPVQQPSYAVSGRVADSGGVGVGGVTISFSGGYGSVTTAGDGTWSKSGLKGTVTVTPAKDGWTFSPSSRQVSGAAGNIDFAATQSSSFPIAFEDPNLEAVVRETIGKPTGQLMNTDVVGIYRLFAIERNISRLGGIEYLVGLDDLRVDDNQISDISPLAGLPGIRGLAIRSNQVSDISPLAGLTNLLSLELDGNQVSDISPLAGLTDLQWLAMSHNQISDISALAGLTNLERLVLDYNQISDITALEGLINLEWLILRDNQISDISSLASLTKMEFLLLEQNQISGISALAGLTSMKWLSLADNQVSDIGALAGLANMELLVLQGNQISDISALAGKTNMQGLSLGYNQISGISALAGLTNLNSLGLAHNQISDISALAGLTNMRSLNLWHNQISDISALAGLTDLEVLYSPSNQISDIGALAGLVNMKWLTLDSNQISDISALAGLANMELLSLTRNQISDIGALVANPGLGSGDHIWLQYNQLDLAPDSDDMENINTLIRRGAEVDYEPQGPAPSAEIRSFDYEWRQWGDIEFHPVTRMPMLP